MSEKLIPHRPTIERDIFGPRLKILAFSDYRVQDINKLIRYIREMVPKPDVIVYAGDDLNRFEEEGRNLFSQLGEFAEHGVLAIAGNADTLDCKRVLNAKHVHDLHEKPYIIGDIAFVGQEGSGGDGGLFPYPEKEIREHLKKQVNEVKRKKLVLVSHNPPYGLLDFARRFGSRHIGSKAILQFLEKHRPVLHICGHVHMYGGKSEHLGSTTILNIASEDYTNAPGQVAIINVWLKWQNPPEINCIIIKEEFLHLYGIGPIRSGQLIRAGLMSCEQIAESSVEEILRKANIDPRTAWLAWLSAKAQIADQIYQISEFSPPEQPIYVDVETTPDECFMTGVYLPNEEIFEQFTVKDIKNQMEKDMVTSRLCRFLKDVNGTIVTFTRYDVKFLPPCILEEKPYYDLYQGIKNAFILPTSDYALKTIGKMFGYPWNNTNPIVGWEIPRLYCDYMEKCNEDYIRQIQDHNMDDVMVMPYLVKKIHDENIAIKCYFDARKYIGLKGEFEGEYTTARKNLDSQRWTDKETTYLLSNITRPAQEIALKLNRSLEAIERKKRREKEKIKNRNRFIPNYTPARKNLEFRKWTDEETVYLLNNITKPVQEIALKLNRSLEAIERKRRRVKS